MGTKIDLKKHWNTAYTSKAPHQLGWYESSSEISLILIEELELEPKAHILTVGVGTSNLIAELIEKGYENITVNDISDEALNILKKNLKETSKNVTFINDDLANPKKMGLIEPVDLWYDRAVLHFFTEKKDQDSYFRLLYDLVKPGGFVIIGAFSTKGAKKCSGLEIKQYDHVLLQDQIGDDFQLIKHLDFTHLTPSLSERPYIYSIFKRK